MNLHKRPLIVDRTQGYPVVTVARFLTPQQLILEHWDRLDRAEAGAASVLGVKR